MRYPRLFNTTVTTGRFSRRAVHNACGQNRNEPSPTTATTGSRSRASDTPRAAGKPQPKPPPREYRKRSGFVVR